MAIENIQIKVDSLINSAQAASSIGEIRKAIKDLQTASLEYRDTNVGAFEQVQAAAGALRDRMADIQDGISNLSASPIENVNNSLGFTGNALKNLDFGGVGLGIKNMATAIKSINFEDISAGFAAIKNGIIAMGEAILANPIFLLAAVIIGITIALVKLKDFIPGVAAVFKLFGDTINSVINGIKNFTDSLGITNFELQRTTKNITDLTIATNELELRYKVYQH